MARQRISTTVDADLLEHARKRCGANDATLFDEALRAMLATHRRAEIDAAIERAYDEHPLSEPDEWGDLESFTRAKL